jgi:hypothetical protein
MFGPKNTATDVAALLEKGLLDGSIILDDDEQRLEAAPSSQHKPLFPLSFAEIGIPVGAALVFAFAILPLNPFTQDAEPRTSAVEPLSLSDLLHILLIAAGLLLFLISVRALNRFYTNSMHKKRVKSDHLARVIEDVSTASAASNSETERERLAELLEQAIHDSQTPPSHSASNQQRS